MTCSMCGKDPSGYFVGGNEYCSVCYFKTRPKRKLMRYVLWLRYMPNLSEEWSTQKKLLSFVREHLEEFEYCEIWNSVENDVLFPRLQSYLLRKGIITQKLYETPFIFR